MDLPISSRLLIFGNAAAGSAPSIWSTGESGAGGGEEGEPVDKPGDVYYLPPPDGVRVARFYVWQDLTGGMNVNREKMAVHAIVTFEMTNSWYLALDRTGGSVRLEGVGTGASGAVEARLLVYQSLLGADANRPGVRHLQFAVSPAPVYLKLAPGMGVRGTARLKFGQQIYSFELPETQTVLIYNF